MKINHSPFALNSLPRRLAFAALSLATLSSPVLSQQESTLAKSSQTFNQSLSSEELQQLLAPIALYPDALIALILPASTVPSDVVLASRFIANNNEPQQISDQSWDNSVQSLARYPDVLTWMDQNLEWTASLGQAFIVQPVDVMNTIQLLRIQADKAGNLVNTPQQVIVREKTIIRIVPAEPEYIYVPQYDPEIVYVQPYSQDYGPLITFGIGFAVGSWLSYDFDWNRHEVYYGDWQPGWDYRRHGNNRNGENNNGNTVVNVVNINQNTAQVWQPSSGSRQQVEHQQKSFNRSKAAGNRVDRNLRNVPKPTRANVARRRADNRNAAASDRNSEAVAPRGAAKSAAGLNPTSPPDVPGQKGKPSRNSEKAEKPDGKNADRQKAARDPKESAPNQIGGDSTADSSKKQTRKSKADMTDRMPGTTEAPQVGRKARSDDEQANEEKRNIIQRENSPAKSESVSKALRTVSPSSTKNQHSKNSNSKPQDSPR